MRNNEGKIGLGPVVAGIAFSIVIAWALISVLELTGTLTSATRIKAHVRTINDNLNPINHDLTFIKYAGHIAALTVQINAAAQPLTHQANTILNTARSIDSKVTPILRNATAINGVVHTINSNAVAINRNVLAIHADVASIGSHVSSITGSVASINHSVGSIHSDVTTILGAVGPIGTVGSSITPDLTRVNGDFAGILSDVQSIQPHLATVSRTLSSIQGNVTGIKGDLDQILTNVGLKNGTPSVTGHANSIDCANIFQLKIAGLSTLGPTADCGGYQP
jgi:uncharacterized protein YoxC